MVEPVVVNPETLSYQALMRVNSPPQRTYGSIPKRHERSQAKTIIAKPSFMFIWFLPPLTNITGKSPVTIVMIPLRNRGDSALSAPYMSETNAPRSMNAASKSSARPIFLDTTVRFIFSQCYFPCRCRLLSISSATLSFNSCSSSSFSSFTSYFLPAFK